MSWTEAVDAVNNTAIPQLSDTAMPVRTTIGHIDALANLPPPARERLLVLRERLDAQEGAILSIREKRDAALLAKGKAEIAHKRMVSSPQDGGVALRLLPDNPSVVQQSRQVALLVEQHQRAAKQFTEVAESVGPLRVLVGRLDAYVLSTAIAPLTVHRVSPDVGKHETHVSALARLRGKITALLEEKNRVASAPKPSSLAKAMARQQITALAENGRIDVHALLDAHGDNMLRWPRSNLQLAMHGLDRSAPALAAGLVLDPLALLAHLFRDELVALAEHEIDAIVDDAHALTADARQRREREIAAELFLALERSECSVIEVAESQGIMIDYRPDTSPAAVLSVATN